MQIEDAEICYVKIPLDPLQFLPKDLLVKRAKRILFNYLTRLGMQAVEELEARFIEDPSMLIVSVGAADQKGREKSG